jgi:hypothetical protein
MAPFNRRDQSDDGDEGPIDGSTDGEDEDQPKDKYIVNEDHEIEFFKGLRMPILCIDSESSYSSY